MFGVFLLGTIENPKDRVTSFTDVDNEFPVCAFHLVGWLCVRILCVRIERRKAPKILVTKENVVTLHL